MTITVCLLQYPNLQRLSLLCGLTDATLHEKLKTVLSDEVVRCLDAIIQVRV